MGGRGSCRASLDAQRRMGGLRDSPHGRAFAVEDQTVFQPVTGQPWGEEANRPPRQASRSSASAVEGAGRPIQPAATPSPPCKMPGASRRRVRSTSIRASTARALQGGLQQQLPGGDRCAAAARQRGRPRSVAQRPLAQRRGRPGGRTTAWMTSPHGSVLAAQVRRGLAAARSSRICTGRFPALRQPRPRPQRPPMRSRFCRSACRLRPSEQRGVGRLAEMRGDPATASSPATYRHPVPPPPRLAHRRSHGQRNEQPSPQGSRRPARLAAPHLPGHRVEIVEGKLPPVGYPAAYEDIGTS